MIQKKLILLTILLLITGYGFANDATNVSNIPALAYEGNKRLTFIPSTDQRVVGHIIYFSDGENEYNHRLDGRLTDEWIIPEGHLHPGKIYTFTATAYDADKNQSEHSSPYYVNIAPVGGGFPEPKLPIIHEYLAPPITITIQIDHQ